MYTVHVQTALTLARLHQEEIRAAFPGRHRGRTRLLRRTEQPAGATPRSFKSAAPTPHSTAAA
jgi:hypothetical protein